MEINTGKYIFKGKCYNKYDRKNMKWFLFIHILKCNQTGMHFLVKRKSIKSLSFYSNKYLHKYCCEFISWNYNYFTDK